MKLTIKTFQVFMQIVITQSASNTTWYPSSEAAEDLFLTNQDIMVAFVIARWLAVAGVAATCAVLSLAGFGVNGIVAGSVAATTQAGIGNVAAGSVFATLQSLGATGLFASGMTFGGAATLCLLLFLI